MGHYLLSACENTIYEKISVPELCAEMFLVEEWIDDDELAWILALWYKFRKSKSWVYNSLVGVVENVLF